IQPLLNEVYDWSVENLKSGMLHDGNVRNIGYIAQVWNILKEYEELLNNNIIILGDFNWAQS
ncbi:MAG: hypothetical protein WAV13_00990, partial [Thermodesulfovibrionales bacterium]